jgi:hypothetical protein
MDVSVLERNLKLILGLEKIIISEECLLYTVILISGIYLENVNFSCVQQS